jgi:hypothetical protein
MGKKWGDHREGERAKTKLGRPVRVVKQERDRTVTEDAKTGERRSYPKDDRAQNGH